METENVRTGNRRRSSQIDVETRNSMSKRDAYKIQQIKLDLSRQLSLVVMSLLLLTGCSGDPTKLTEESRDFVDKQLSTQIGKWRKEKLAINEKVSSKADTEAAFLLYRTYIGNLEQVEDIELANATCSAGINVPDFRASYNCKLRCQRGPADAKIVVDHKNDNWSVFSLTLNSNVLRKALETESKSAQKSLDSTWTKIAKNWSMAELRKYSSKALLKEIGDSGLILTTLRATFGNLQNIESSRWRQCLFRDGQRVMVFDVTARYEKGSPNTEIQMVKEGNNWKIRAFNITNTVTGNMN